jgi:hypothetical protein
VKPKLQKKPSRVTRALGGFIPFAALSAHKQRDAFIRLRSKIDRNRERYGGDFKPTSAQEPGRPAFLDQIEQFYFLGRDGRTIWNCYLESANREYWGEISSIAYDRTEEIAPRQRTFDLNDLFTPLYDETGKRTGSTMNPEETDPRLGDQTRSEYQAALESVLIQEDSGSTAPVFEGWRIDRQFEYGIGIYAVVDVPWVDRQAIRDFLDRFRSQGETEWRADTPVPRDKLPRETFMQLLDSPVHKDAMARYVNSNNQSLAGTIRVPDTTRP